MPEEAAESGGGRAHRGGRCAARHRRGGWRRPAGPRRARHLQERGFLRHKL